MELHTVNRQLGVPHGHNDTAAGARGNFQHRRQRLRQYGQRVVPGRRERIRKPLQHTGIGVKNAAGLPVQQLRRTVHGGTECNADCLVPQADSEQWGTRRGARANQADRRTRPFRGTRPWAQQNTVEPGDDDGLVRQSRVVVAPYLRLDTELPEVLHQVENEAVVIVDNQDPHRVRVPFDGLADIAQYASIAHRAGWLCDTRPDWFDMADDLHVRVGLFGVAQ